MVDRWKHKIWTLSDKVEIFTPNPQYSNQCQCGWLAQMHFPSTALDEVEEFSQLLAYIKTVRLWASFIAVQHTPTDIFAKGNLCDRAAAESVQGRDGSNPTKTTPNSQGEQIAWNFGEGTRLKSVSWPKRKSSSKLDQKTCKGWAKLGFGDETLLEHPWTNEVLKNLLFDNRRGECFTISYYCSENDEGYRGKKEIQLCDSNLSQNSEHIRDISKMQLEHVRYRAVSRR